MTAPNIIARETEPADPRLRVVLVAMPFMEIRHPSIQIGLLKSITAARGFPVRTLHANLDFAARIDIDDYQLLCQHRGPMVGEWLFSLPLS